MAAAQREIQTNSGLVFAENWFFEQFAKEIRRATIRHLDEINAGLAAEKAKDRKEQK